MGAPENFFNDLQNFLQVRLVVTTFVDAPNNPPGDRGRINVNETFGVHITVTNIAPLTSEQKGVYFFKNIKVWVKRTAFATPLRNLTASAEPVPAVSVDITPAMLIPGQRGTGIVHMKALSNIGGIADWILAEEIAKVNVQTEFDYQTYFKILTPERVFNHEIEP